MDPEIKLFQTTSEVMTHPYLIFGVSPGYKVLGGGARDNWSEPGNLLTASYPLDYATWVVNGKDQGTSSPSSVTAYVFAINDPNDEWDVTITSSTSDPVAHPQAETFVSNLQNYVLTGGGALVSYGNGAGNLLTVSCPLGEYGWQACSKDHGTSDPCSITAYAIGIKSLKGRTVNHKITSATGSVAAHPTAHASLDPHYMLTGGGAIDRWSGFGNLLTGSYPDGQGWTATGKDHGKSSPAAITAYAIGLQFS